MAERPPLSIRIGGTLYKVQATAGPDEIRRLAERVDVKLREVNPGNRPVTAQMFLLVAMAFAHEASEERALREAAAAQAGSSAQAEAEAAARDAAERAASEEALAQLASLRAEAETERARSRAALGALGAELERERERSRATAAEARDVLRRVLSRIDLALEEDETDGDEEPADGERPGLGE